MVESESSEWQRNDKKSKNFQCPCGKSYLSYPALYTHIKQAHGGKAPGEIKRPDAHNRGRPKTSGNCKIEQHNKSIEDSLKSDPIPELAELLSTAQVLKNREIRDIYQNQPVFKLIMNDKDRQFAPKFLREDRVFDVKMGEGVIEFFKDVQKKIDNKNAYDEIVMLIVLLTEHIIEETEDQNVLNLGTISLMPEFVNYFIIHDFKKPVQRLKLENLWIFQDQNSIKVFNIFFKWMLFKKFTLTKVQINQKYLNPSEEDSQEQVEKDQNNEDDDGENEKSNEEEQKEDEKQKDEQQNGDKDVKERKGDQPQQDEQEQQMGQISRKKLKSAQQMIESDKVLSV